MAEILQKYRFFFLAFILLILLVIVWMLFFRQSSDEVPYRGVFVMLRLPVWNL